MQSPTALEKYQDDAATNPRTTEYSQSHPTGTGPFEFESFERGKQVTLAGTTTTGARPAHIDKAVIVAIEDPKARADALRNGEIDGFDLVGPADVGPLEDEGFTIVNRDAFNVLYLGMNQAVKPLDDIKVRQAIAYALNKEEIISASMAPETRPAIEFIPEIVNGYTEDVPTYDYDPEKAKQLLAGGRGRWGHHRVQLPDRGEPSLHAAARGHLQRDPHPARGGGPEDQADGRPVGPRLPREDPGHEEPRHPPARLDRGLQRHRQLPRRLLRSQEQRVGLRQPGDLRALDEARAIPTPEEQEPLYEDINREVMEYLPGVPLGHPVPSLAFDSSVQGFQQSPVQDEPWNVITLEE